MLVPAPFEAAEAWKGKKVFVEFEGAMQVARRVGQRRHVTAHFGGYAPFTVDVTDLLDQGGADNVLALRLDNTDNPDVPPGKPRRIWTSSTSAASTGTSASW